ncbi:MAG: HisS family protein [bacterium]|nr:HisS family protein [bacterium]
MGRPKKITPTVEKAPASLEGSFDLLADHHSCWNFFVDRLNNLSQTFSYSKLDTPLLEDARLFKFWTEAGPEQLLFLNNDKDTRLAVKPTNLFGVARAYLEHKFYEREKVTKWFYLSPVAHVTADKQIKQQHEYGFQIFGDTAGIADAQIINLLLRLFKEIGLNKVTLHINNVGCLECRPIFQEVLKNFFKDKKYDLCESCLEYIETNPLKILACSNLSCNTVISEAPVVVDFLCENCRAHFVDVLEGLEELNISFNLNQKVIGQPWSRKTVFDLRVQSDNLEEVKLGEGGHADDLIQSLGGPPITALGFSGTVQSALEALEQANVKYSTKSRVDVFLVPLGELAAKKTLRLFTDLWNHNIVASEFIGPGSIRTQLKLAESNKASIALIVGQKEARDGTVILRDVRSGMQELFTVERIIEEVKKRLGK